jgi:KipI family sensor histidine kinase inhibitor
MSGAAATGQAGEPPRFLDAGEAALVVEFGRTVDPAINDRVLALDAALAADPPDGLRELVPTYRSLMIHYDPLRLDREALVSTVRDRLAGPVAPATTGACWIMPCCYEDGFGEDLGEAAGLLGITPEKLVALHSGATLRMYMYGFAPGFSYLGGLPEALAISRRATPRPPHAAGAVAIGGGLGSIATVSMPTGWYVVGCTPERLYAPERQSAFLMQPGDALRFEPIDAATYHALADRAVAGEVVARRISA